MTKAVAPIRDTQSCLLFKHTLPAGGLIIGYTDELRDFVIAKLRLIFTYRTQLQSIVTPRSDNKRKAVSVANVIAFLFDLVKVLLKTHATIRVVNRYAE